MTSEERGEYEARASQPTLPGADREATSERNFRFDVCGTRSSPWNKSAARVFAGLAIRQLCLPNTISMHGSLRHAFSAHLERIIRRYKDSQKSLVEQRRLKSDGNRRTRKYQVGSFLPSFFYPLTRPLALSSTALHCPHVWTLAPAHSNARIPRY